MKKFPLSLYLVLLVTIFGCSVNNVNPTNDNHGSTTATQLSTVTLVPSRSPTQASFPTSTSLPTAIPVVNICTDVKGDVGKPEVDIINGSTLINGEELIAKFSMLKVPDELEKEINSNAIKTCRDCGWAVFVDTDSDPSTGGPGCGRPDGFDYVISLDRKSLNSSPLTSEFRPVIYKIVSDSYRIFNSASFEVNNEDNSISLIGSIPGINEKSRQCLYASENVYTGGRADYVPCELSSYTRENMSTNPQESISQPNIVQTPTYESMNPSTPSSYPPAIVNYCSDSQGEVDRPEVDIVSATTSLEGEELTIVISLSEVPKGLKINKPEWVKYGVDIDTDNNQLTGGPGMTSVNQTDVGYDYEISALHIIDVEQSSDFLASILQSFVWRINDDYSMLMDDTATFKVDYENNTITLIGKIPGIDDQSRLTIGTSEDNITCPIINKN
jgi:hypothetical protein